MAEKVSTPLPTLKPVAKVVDYSLPSSPESDLEKDAGFWSDSEFSRSELSSQGSDLEKKKEGKGGDDDGSDDGSGDGTAMSGMPLIVMTVGMMVVVFMMTLDHYILATATPKITTEFNSLQDAAWYSSGYFLTNMALQPAFGQLYRFFSVKMVYMLSVVIFEIGSLICALAPSSAVLIFGRLITGIGGGGLYIGCVVLVGYAVPIHKRAFYISMVTSLDGVASAAGPLLGGVFTDSSLTWRFCFWINLPLGFIAFVILAVLVKDPPRHKQLSIPKLQRLAKVDWTSMILLIAGFALLLLALEWAGPIYPWSDIHVWGCLVGAVLILTAYLVLQYFRGEDAAIPYRILKQRTVFFSSGFMLLMAMVIGALTYYLPFYFQAAKGDSARDSGVFNLPFLMSVMFSPLVTGFLISLWGHYVPFMWFGSVLATVGSALLTTWTRTTGLPLQIAFQFLAGFGSGSSHQIPYTSIQHVMPDDEMVLGSALCSFLNSLGSILGIVSAQAVFAGVLTGNLSKIGGIDAQTVILAGPTDVASAVPGPLVNTVRDAYASALSSMFILPAVLGGLGIICCMGVEWKRIKKS